MSFIKFLIIMNIVLNTIILSSQQTFEKLAINFLKKGSKAFVSNLFLSGSAVVILDLVLPDENSEKLHAIQKDLRNISTKIIGVESDVKKLLEKVGELPNILPILNKFTDIRIKIESKLDKVNDYITLNQPLSNYTVDEFARDTAGVGADSLPLLLKQLQKTLFDDDKKLLKYFTRAVIEQTLEFSTNCTETAHDKLYELFTSLAALEARSLFVFRYKLKIFKNRNLGSFETEKQLIANDANKRMKHLKQEFKEILAAADSTLYKLDPYEHVLDKTYVAITRFHQFYIANEAFFGTCGGFCEYFKAEQTDFNDRIAYEEQQPCNGSIYGCKKTINGELNCRNTHSGYLAEPSNHMRYSRLVEYNLLVGTLGIGVRILGALQSVILSEESVCALLGKSTLVHSYGKVAKPGEKFTIGNLRLDCEPCECICDEPDSPLTIRKISLSVATADTKRNYVITGFRFTEKFKIIYLQIQQSKLLPGGRIDPSTSEWKNLPTEENTKYVIVDPSTEIFIGESFALNGFVLTGIKFVSFSNIIELKLKFALINFHEGTILQTILWKWTQCTEFFVHADTDKDNPTLYTDNKPNGKDGYYKFVQSSMESDVGQTTIPFFDAQPVITSFAPIVGFALHVRDNEKSGGFIAAKITTLNFAKFIGV